MKQTALVTLLIVGCASAAMAQDPADYQTALDDALAEYEAERAAVTGKSYYALNLTSKGTITRESDPDGARHTFRPELVAVFDKTTKLCAWGFDSDLYPKLPRTAARAVQSAAAHWPAEATQATALDEEACTRRSYLATLIGDLDRIYIAKDPDRLLYLGFPPSEGGS
tara:strand:- start:1148 stop:1651 length:504 start_codon:yes stop_codon:yes gene_type:complete